MIYSPVMSFTKLLVKMVFNEGNLCMTFSIILRSLAGRLVAAVVDLAGLCNVIETNLCQKKY